MYGDGITAAEYDAWVTARSAPHYVTCEPQPLDFEPFKLVGPGHRDYSQFADPYVDDDSWFVIDIRIGTAPAPAGRFEDEAQAAAFAAEHNALAQAGMRPPRFDVAEYPGQPHPWAVMDYIDCDEDDSRAVPRTWFARRTQAEAYRDQLLAHLRSGRPVPRI